MSVQTKDFFELVKAIGESRSKQEEDRIVADEVLYLKKAIPQQGVPKKKMKELIVRSIYVEMLGQDASFAYIKAVELCASTNISQKKIGYLAASVCLSPDHEFRFMLINQIQRDLKSANQLEVCTALTAVCKLITEDMIPAVIGDIMKLMNHESDLVRKKLVCALHRVYQLDKATILDAHLDKLRKALCDKDPSVMAATLPLFQIIIKDDPMVFKDLVSSFVSILKQIIEHRLPKEFDYHRIPAPWIQMNLLRILAMLGRGDQASSEGMYEVVVEVMKRADTGINVGYAIVYEVVQTVTTIYPNPLLLDAAATAISRFIRSDSHNLKYIGIKGLAAIVKDHPKYAADHQMAVIDCLEDPDETLKRKTLDLLFRMTNAVNVEFIVDKLLSFLASAIDDHFRSDLVGQITQCAERFAPSNAWYVQTIIRVFELAGEKVKASVAHTLTQLIAEGTDEDEEDENADDELRKEAVENFLDLLERPKLPAILANSMAWVLGEYGYLSESCTIEEIMEKLLNLVKKASDSTTKAHAISALIKLVAQNGSCPARVLELVKMYSQSQSLDVQQRAIEFQALIINSHVMADILPVDASCEDLDLDEDLSFLNGFVEQALNYGASPYNPPALDEDEGDSRKKSSLKITPYEKPALPQAAPSGGIVGGLANGPAPTTISSPSQSQPTPSSASPAVTVSPNMSAAAVKGNQLINSRGVAQVWGKKPDPVAAPTPPPVPEPAAVSEKIPTPEKVTVTQISTPTNQQQQYSAPVEPPQPKVLSEKEKFAAALFGGVGGGTSRTTATRKRSTTGAKDSLKASPTTAASPPAATVSPVMTNAYISSELLDMPVPVEPLSPAVTTPAPQPVSPQVPSNINDDFMGLTISPMPAMAAATPSMSAPAMAMQGGNISDMFASMNVISASASTDVQPLRINTAEFGRRWGTVNADVKLSVPIRIMTLEKLKTVVPSTYHHVESIPNTAEAIFAATLTTNGSIILIHTKLHLARKVCDILVKSSSKEISTREMNIISHAISSAN